MLGDCTGGGGCSGSASQFGYGILAVLWSGGDFNARFQWPTRHERFLARPEFLPSAVGGFYRVVGSAGGIAQQQCAFGACGHGVGDTAGYLRRCVLVIDGGGVGPLLALAARSVPADG